MTPTSLSGETINHNPEYQDIFLSVLSLFHCLPITHMLSFSVHTHTHSSSLSPARIFSIFPLIFLLLPTLCPVKALS